MTPKYGFVYIMRNDFMPNLYKVGMTFRSPAQRAQELSSTGLPGSFEVVYYAEVLNPCQVEARVHWVLSGFRVNQQREFFAVKAMKIIDVIMTASEEIESSFFINETMFEIANPGVIFKDDPVWFEKGLPDIEITDQVESMVVRNLK